MKNVITWFDIPTLDFDRAVRFYSDILGAPVRVDEHMGQKIGFFPMAIGSEGVGGDLVPPSKEHVPSTNGTRVYLSCESIDAVLPRVEVSGGKILKEKFSIGTPGYVAIIADTEGNMIGLHSLV